MNIDNIREKEIKQPTNDSGEIHYLFALNSDQNFSSDNSIQYGPIRFYPRRGNAPTLLTGRRSKFTELNGEEEIQRELRREKNRLLAKRLKEKRENILNDLTEHAKELEEQHFYLINRIQQLKLYKTNLSNQLKDSNQDPLLNLINQNQIPLFFEQYDDEDFDTNSVISTLSDEQSSVDDLLSPESQ